MAKRKAPARNAKSDTITKRVTRGGSVRLTKKQEAFAVAYIKLGNASDAYRVAYDTARMNAVSINKEASRLLAHPLMSPRLESLRAPSLAKAGLTVDRVLKEVERISFFDPRKLYRDDGNAKRPDEWDDDTAAAIGGVEVSEEYEGKGEDRALSGYTKKFKIWDKNAALEKAMKHLGLYEKDNKQRGESLPALQVLIVK